MQEEFNIALTRFLADIKDLTGDTIINISMYVTAKTPDLLSPNLRLETHNGGVINITYQTYNISAAAIPSNVTILVR